MVANKNNLVHVAKANFYYVFVFSYRHTKPSISIGCFDAKAQ
jgi:hypothetical protein